jgi:hypothetical protein
MRRPRGSSRVARATAVIVAMVCSFAAPNAAWAASGDEQWTDTFDLDAMEDFGFAIAVSSDGTRLYVGGFTTIATRNNNDFLTIAYDAATGQRVWKRRFTGPGERRDTISGIVLSPDDGTLFVTGTSEASNGQTHIRTIAYEAASGLVRWSRQFHDVVGNPFAIAASPDGTAVFVTGSSVGAKGRDQMVTIAYAAETGVQEWVRRYDGVDNRPDMGVALGVGADSNRVFVTGVRDGGRDQHDFVTIAYRTSGGTTAWTSVYDGPAGGSDEPSALAVSPDGTQVFVTGHSRAETHDYTTIAYSAGSGQRAWVRRYDGAGAWDQTFDVVATVDAVFVTGRSVGAGTGYDAATVAYDVSTGHRLWVDRYDGPDSASDVGGALTASLDGSEVYVAGSDTAGGASDVLTIAYVADSGVTLWESHYDGSAGLIDFAIDVAVDPLGARVFVTGTTWSDATSVSADWLTIAYAA